MAYANKYKITMATKSGSTSTLYLQEDGYVGSVYEYPAVSLQIQYLPKSDDIFEPIYASQLNVVIDVTDNVTNMPDFTSLNDRKYLCKLYYDSTLEWQGWALSDYVQMSYTTGRRTLAFNAIDGLGMLEKILYQLPTDYTLVGKNTCLNYLLSSLSLIGFNLNLISGISFYASGMQNRGDGTQFEPLKQTYLNYATIVNDNEQVINSLSIISAIVKGFGARIFQANGKWNIVSLTEFAQSSYYFTEYNSSGAVVTSGTKSLTGQIQGYTSNISGLFYVDNSQYKILRKGYNKIRFQKTIEIPNNYVTNWDLKRFEYINPTLSNAFGWTETRGTSGLAYVKSTPNLKYNTYILLCDSSAPYIASVKPNNLPKVATSDLLNLSFEVASHGVPASGPQAMVIVKLQVVNPITLDSFALTQDAQMNPIWGPITDIYYVPFEPSNSRKNISINIPPVPEGGNLSLEFLIYDGAVGPYPVRTLSSIELDNFKLEVQPTFTEVLTESYISNSLEYVYNVDLPIGFNNVDDGYYSYKGFLSDSTGLNLKDWYRYEYPTEIYRSLSELVIKQYSNCLNKNIINIDASFMGMNTTNGRFSSAMRLTSADSDPAQISVNDKKYILGNSTIDLFNDTIQATLLEISDLNPITSLQTTYTSTSNTGTGPAPIGRNRSNGYLTKEEAYAAALTEFKVYLVQGDYYTPSVGDVYYVDNTFITPFNGAALWWKIMTTDTSFKAFKISSSGIIQEIYG